MKKMAFLRALCLSVLLGNLAHSQLLIDLSVDVTQGDDGLFTYVYTLENSDFSTQSVNTFFFTTPRGADIQLESMSGPNVNWVPLYDKDLTPANLQGVFITGLNEAGDTCGVSRDNDIFPGDSAEFTFVSSWAPQVQENANPPTSIGFTSGALCDFVGAIAQPNVAVPAIPVDPPGLSCDFDGDGDCDVRDIDNLNATIVAELNDLTYDITGDSAVNTADLELFLKDVERLNGDTDLNGAVEFADFLALSENFGEEGDWSMGDFDSSGDVGFPDFLILSDNFGRDFLGAAAVPEPNSFVLIGYALSALFVLRRRR